MFQSEYKQKKEAKDEAIYRDYCEMMKQPGAMKMVVMAEVAKKHGLYSITSVWKVRKRMANRIMEESKF